MGGAQMYIRNKMLDLEARGWHVEVFYNMNGKILIPELRKFEKNFIPELGLPLFSLSKSKRNKVLNKIAACISSDEVIIESVCFTFRHWGELIAKRLSGLNLLFFVNEDYPNLSRADEEYLLWKQRRGEFLNDRMIKEKVSTRIIAEHDDNHFLKLTPYNNVLSYDEFNFQYDNTLPVITSIGRLEKNYILPMVKEVIKFADCNNIKVNLFFIGGTYDPIYLDEIKSEFAKTEKVIPLFFGYTFPIPIDIIKASDVIIAVSGSVLVGASQNIPTISIEVNDTYPLGVFGHTTNSRLYRTTEPIISTSELLKHIILEGKYREPIIYVDQDAESINQYNAVILEKIRYNSKEYYNIDNIFSKMDYIYYNTKIIIRRLFGNSIIDKIKETLKK